MGHTRDRWKEVTVAFNDNKIDLPRIVAIMLWDKIKVRRLMNREPLLFHVMIRQGITCRLVGFSQEQNQILRL